ncbi:hypothetical protein HID58_000833 [Brassica napus]|uniref:Uncharacterized protein n=1 Tax=Brassica napus TaxID=3708 RepID=A0ABQ8EKN3_BRANA|nr:hypothetical protein HID58_000833 [Brassica napus]
MWGHTRMPTLLWSTQTRMTSADSIFASKGAFLCFLRSIMSSSFESYEEYVEIHSRCMRQLGLSVRSSLASSYPRHLLSFCAGDSTITCLQVKQMMGKLMMMVIHILKTLKNLWSCFHEVNMQRVAPKSYQQAAGVVFDLGITLDSKLMASGPSQGSVLDGSSNIIAGVSTGSIIGVYNPYESNDISTVNELLSLSLSTWPLRKDTQCRCCTVGFTGAAKSRNIMHKPLDFYCKPFSDYMVPLKFLIDA